MRQMEKHKLSIQTIFMFFFLLLSITPLLLNSGFGYWKSSETIKSNASQYVTQILRQTNGEIDYKLLRLGDDCVPLLTNNAVQNMLRQNRPVDLLANEELFQILNQFSMENGLVNRVSLYDKAGSLLSANAATELRKIPDNLLNTVKDLDGAVLWLSGYTMGMPEHDEVFGIRAVKNLNGPAPTEIGYLVVSVLEQVVQDTIKGLQLGTSGASVIFDSFGEIVTEQKMNDLNAGMHASMIDSMFQNKEGSFESDISGKKVMVYFSTNQAGFKTVGLIPEKEMTPGLGLVQKFTIVLIAISGLLSIALAYIVARSLTKPLKVLIKQMKDLEINQESVPVVMKSNREIFLLSSSFSKMQQRLKELIHQVYEKEIKEKQAELKALQAQINPHFLYNTLDTLYWMLYIKGEEEVGELIVSLSNLLRYSIKKDESFVLVQDEVDHLKNYIAIQSVRYRDRIRFEIELDPDAAAYSFLKLTLQPIVENAITHGLEKSERPGLVKIHVKSEAHEIRITIADNGIGMMEEMVDYFNHNQRMLSGMGIQNVADRLRLHYGEEYGMQISSKPGEGTTFLIRIPKIVPNGQNGA